MKKITHQEIKEIAENMVNKTNSCSSNYDAIEDVCSILKEMLIKMDIQVEEPKKCKCENCSCNKQE